MVHIFLFAHICAFLNKILVKTIMFQILNSWYGFSAQKINEKPSLMKEITFKLHVKKHFKNYLFTMKFPNDN